MEDKLKIKEVLVKIRDLFVDVKKWTKKAEARDCYFRPVFAKNRLAVCWCMEGAIILYTDSYIDRSPIINHFQKTLDNGYDTSIQKWNDNAYLSHEQLMQKINQAIEAI